MNLDRDCFRKHLGGDRPASQRYYLPGINNLHSSRLSVASRSGACRKGATQVTPYARGVIHPLPLALAPLKLKYHVLSLRRVLAMQESEYFTVAIASTCVGWSCKVHVPKLRQRLHGIINLRSNRAHATNMREGKSKVVFDKRFFIFYFLLVIAGRLRLGKS